MHWARRLVSVDLIFGAVATCFGLLSLDYPFAREQGFLYYPAREWLLRGRLPYRDVLAIKTPIIYLIHMLAIALFGEHLWAIRLLELALAVPCVALIAARLATPRATRLTLGVFGAAWLAIAIFYYGYSGFWETGQSEIWVALFAGGSLCAATRAHGAWLACGAAGALSALALLTDPAAAVFFVLLTLAAVALRAREATGGGYPAIARAIGTFVTGALATSGALLSYFALLHALAPMLDVLIGAHAFLAEDVPQIRDPRELVKRTALAFVGFEPYSIALLFAVGSATFVGVLRRDRAPIMRYGRGALLALASYAAVISRGTFYAYHWATLVLAVGVLGAVLYSDLLRAARGHRATPAVFAGFALLLFLMSGPQVHRWTKSAIQTARYELGWIDREEFTRSFDVPSLYAYHDAELVGVWLRKHSAPNDSISVRGIEPEIYAVSQRYFTGRFFWTWFLTFPTKDRRFERWRAEEGDVLRRQPPRYVVTYDFVEEGSESASWFEQLGYQERTRIGPFIVLERHPAAASSH